MKILTVSDRVVESIYSVSIKQQFGDVDLVLACGDLPPYYLEFIVTMLGVPLLYVFGNHDQGVFTFNGKFKHAPEGCINVDERIVQVKGLLIGGLEGSMLYSGQGDHQYTEWDMIWKALRMAPALWWNRLRYGRFLDILITHAPPYRIHDGVDRCHTGFKTFLRMMDIYHPRYLIHGHVHVYSPHTIIRTTYGRTQVVNTYGYQIINWRDVKSGDG
ncbi:MAG: metallophosphoesterase [Chloroflexi bacterium]|nr:MAG: metallophosphoesterase [Chloroflexota bacterium]